VHVLALPHLPRLDHAGVHDHVARPPLGVHHPDHPAAGAHVAVVGDLASGLRIERSAIEDQADVLALLGHPRPPAVEEQGDQVALGLQGLVPEELRGSGRGGPGQLLLHLLLLRGPPGTVPLLGHQGLEPLLVDRQARVLEQLPGELPGEAERVVQLEHHVAR